MISLLPLLVTCGLLTQPSPAQPRLVYGAPRELGALANPKITESSGIAASRARPDLFWTHNDSGDSPRLFAFDARGHDMGEYALSGTKAMDWEDIASFTRDGEPLLLIADVGDNLERRSEYQLYLVSEPKTASDKPRLLQTIRYFYEDGPHNCESVGVDPALDCILLVSKRAGLTNNVYQLDFPKAEDTGVAKARRIATLTVPWPTAMDISPDGSRAVILTYGDAYGFIRAPQEDWKTAMSRESIPISMPQRTQGESICFGADGESLFLTSEKTPCPLWVVPALPASK